MRAIVSALPVVIADLMDGVEVRPEYAGTTICFSKRSSEA